MKKIINFMLILIVLFTIKTVNAKELTLILEVNEFENGTSYVFKNTKNYFKSRKSLENEKIYETFIDMELSLEKINQSENIYVSIEKIYKEVEKNVELTELSNDNYEMVEEDEYIADSYITIKTVVYDYGYLNTEYKLFETYTTINYTKKFKLKNEDHMFIRNTVGNALPYFNNEHDGSFIYFEGPNPVGGMFSSKEVIADYSFSTGITYKVNLPNGSDTNSWQMFGNYWFIANDSCTVQSGYVHNEKIFGGTISFSIDILSFEVKSATEYFARPITILL